MQAPRPRIQESLVGDSLRGHLAQPLPGGRDHLCHLLGQFCPGSPKPTPPSMMGRALRGVWLGVMHDACFQGTCSSETSA